MEYLGAYLMLLVMGTWAVGMYLVQADRYRQRQQLEDSDKAMDEVQEESYNGKPLWITEEERPYWEAMTREEKRKVIRDVEKKIREGKVYVHTDENGFTGLISAKEAKEKGYI